MQNVKSTFKVTTVGSTATQVWLIQNAHVFNSINIILKNTGSVALTVAVLQGSFDGSSWITIDASGITTAFGTLAAGASANKFETDLMFPHLQLLLTCGTSTTINGVVVTSEI